MKAAKKPIHAVTTWVRRQPPKVKAFLGVVSAMAALVLLRMIVHDHDNFFVAAEAVHALGISVLIYKLTKEKTCAGKSKFSNFFGFEIRVDNNLLFCVCFRQDCLSRHKS